MSTSNQTAGARRRSLPPSTTVQRMKALGDPVRWGVMEILSHGERCVCDLESRVGIAQSRLSYHLGILRDAGLITDRRSGRWVYYSLDTEAVEETAAPLVGLVGTWRAEGRFQEGTTC